MFLNNINRMACVVIEYPCSEAAYQFGIFLNTGTMANTD